MPEDSPDEEVLLQMVAKGSKKAFETLYNRYYISIFYFTKRFVADQKAAEDITTETFLKLWERLSHFVSLEGIRAFLHTTAKNACLNHLRNETRQSTHQRELAYLLNQPGAEDAEEHQIRARVYQYIYAEIEKLPAQIKRVFKMAYIEGLSNQEIADRLKINNQSVRNHKARALRHLRMALWDKDLYEIMLVFLAFSLRP
ncbi:MAG TPA: RNA polymerase sigma-70 factor [Puia sp.]|nr:RNA polymerase sigma-70 factor [Puia sp.]